ncbi:MAG: ribosome silencing factor [Dehalococcoidales bacterium]|nr:ribosome silencing factor [Dehalococcoidales bacterium]
MKLEAIEIARIAVAAADEKQARDIVLLDARAVCGFADYFVLCTGESDRQLRAILDEIEHVLKKTGVVPHHSEGSADSGWVLLDYGAVIVHVFAPEERDYYQLDRLWSTSSPVLRIQ